jgi:hypothetical protein
MSIDPLPPINEQHLHLYSLRTGDRPTLPVVDKGRSAVCEKEEIKIALHGVKILRINRKD